MIERDGILVHIDPTRDRFEDEPLEFTGWVAADRPVQSVWLVRTELAALTTCDRPDVKRVFPSLTSIGFSGTCKASDLGQNGLRLAVRLGDLQVEVEHPLPPPLPKLSRWKGMLIALRMLLLRTAGYLTTNRARKWILILQRHLLDRERRSCIFRRAHTDALLSDFAAAFPDAAVMQIGANDGFTGDPLNHLISRPDTRWRGLLVEPVPHLFAKLAERYGNNPLLQLECAAVGEGDGVTAIYRLQTSAGDSLWLDQLPSLDRDLLQRTAKQMGNSSGELVTETVACFCVKTLLERHHLQQLDLLVIDTEGWDWRILRQFDLSRLRPKLILYEHQHLRPEESEQAHQFLAAHNYEWAQTAEGDTLAWTLS